MDPITIAIIGLIAARVVGMGATDIAYAVRGKDSPRWEARKAAIKASAETGRPVRYGFGGYMADMVDDAWVSARERRERKLAGQVGQVPQRNKPMRSYLGRVWGHRWEDAGLKHDQKHRDRQIKRGLIDPDTPAGGGLDKAFDTVPRDNTPTASPPPKWSEYLTVSELGMTELPSAEDLVIQIGGQHAAYREQMARDHARQLAIRDLMQQRLNSAEGQTRAHELITQYPDTWHQHLRAELAASAATDPDLEQQVTDRYRLLMHRVNTKYTPKPKEDTTIPTPGEEPPITTMLDSLADKWPVSLEDTVTNAETDAALEHQLRNRAQYEALGELMRSHLMTPIGQKHLDQFVAEMPDPVAWKQAMKQWVGERAEADPQLADLTESKFKELKAKAASITAPKEDTTTDTNPAESSTPMASATPSTVTYLHEFINRKDPNTMTTTANAEAVGLDDAIIYAEQSTQHHTDTASALELFKISLAQGGCGQGTLGIVDEIDDANTVIQGLYQRLHDSLVQDKVTVGDAYNARPDAGTKEFVTN